jgi:hypothetical protein
MSNLLRTRRIVMRSQHGAGFGSILFPHNDMVSWHNGMGAAPRMLLRPLRPHRGTENEPIAALRRRGPSGARAARLQCRAGAAVIEYLSPREEAELKSAAAQGEPWARILLTHFTDGPRLRLGWDEARSESEIAAALRTGDETRDAGSRRRQLGEALQRAGRWAAEHGLHLLSFSGEAAGDDPVGEPRHFMAVG